MSQFSYKDVNGRFNYDRGNANTFKVAGATEQQLREWYREVRDIEVAFRCSEGPRQTKKTVEWVLNNLADLADAQRRLSRKRTIVNKGKGEADEPEQEKAEAPANLPLDLSLPGNDKDVY